MKYKTTGANRGCCMMNKEGCNRCGCKQQSSYDWLCDIPGVTGAYRAVEVQFKNTRKGYYQNLGDLDVHKGDMIVVEAQTGYDIGEVTLTGPLVELAMKKHRIRGEASSLPRLLRFPSEADMERRREAIRREEPTMIEARQIASRLSLEMKIGDVEYQGDGNKAIFYYIADGRVDFRQLIRVLAEAFRIRIEMKQIGARQEAGRIGGIGPCGRELCCASWASNFISVNTNAARIQDLSSNPQKLTGLCGKLKCCMNYEVHAYAEAQRNIPQRDIVLETKAGDYYFFKADYLRRIVSYSKVNGRPEGLVAISVRRAYEIIGLNKGGKRPDTLMFDEASEAPAERGADILTDNSLTRFDGKKASSRSQGKSRRKSVDRGASTESKRPPKDETSAPRKTQQSGAGRRSRAPRGGIQSEQRRGQSTSQDSKS